MTVTPKQVSEALAEQKKMNEACRRCGKTGNIWIRIEVFKPLSGEPVWIRLCEDCKEKFIEWLNNYK